MHLPLRAEDTTKFEAWLSTRWFVAIFPRPQAAVPDAPVETRYMPARALRHHIAVDALRAKSSSSFFEDIVPQTARLLT